MAVGARTARLFWTATVVLAAACGGGSAPVSPSPPSSPSTPIAPAAPSRITLLATTPPPGSEVVMSDLGGLVMVKDLLLRFLVRSAIDLPDAKLEIDLLDDAGRRCHYTFVDQAVPAGRDVAVDVDGVIVWESSVCSSFPMHISTVKATLLTLREPVVNGRLQRTDYVVETFDAPFTIHRWPPPPANPVAAPPSITEMYWKGIMHSPPDPPLPDDSVTVGCRVTESDGAPVTITLAVTWEGSPAVTTFSQDFPAGASSSPQGAFAMYGFIARAMYGAATCTAVNNRGESAKKTISIGR